MPFQGVYPFIAYRLLYRQNSLYVKFDSANHLYTKQGNLIPIIYYLAQLQCSQSNKLLGLDIGINL